MENEGNNLLNDEEKYIDDKLNARDDIESDEQRDREAKRYKFEFLSTQLSGLTTEAEPEESEKGDEDDKKSQKSKPPSSKEKEREKDKEKEKETDKEESERPESQPARPPTPRLDAGQIRWRNEVFELK
jgi:outer membrane biosynthesis protein TonB